MIIQQVNLYQDSIKPKQLNINLYLLGALAVMLVIVVSTINGYLMHQLRNTHKQVEQAREVLGVEQARVKILEATLPKQDTDTALAAEVEHWQHKVDDLKATVALLTSKKDVHLQGFAQYFQALANQPVANAWLTSIHFDAEQQRIQLEGSTFKTDKIPYFLQQLQNEAVFRGRTFAQLVIQESEQVPTLMNFKLSTHLDSEKKHDAN